MRAANSMKNGVMMTKQDNPDRRTGVLARLRRFIRAKDGVAAVEFALIGPILIVMILGVVEAGRLFWFQSSLEYQVEEAARYAMTHYTREFYTLCDPQNNPADSCAASLLGDVDSTANTSLYEASFAWDPSGASLSATADPGAGTALDYLLVEGDYNFTFAVGMIPGLDLIFNMTLHAETRVPMLPFE